MITPVVIPMTVSVSNVQIPMSVSVSNVQMQMSIGAAYSIVDGDWYDGEYDVTPMLTDQTLLTRDKLMRNNVTVREIPVTSTSNPYGGQTVVIG